MSAVFFGLGKSVGGFVGGIRSTSANGFRITWMVLAGLAGVCGCAYGLLISVQARKKKQMGDAEADGAEKTELLGLYLLWLLTTKKETKCVKKTK